MPHSQDKVQIFRYLNIQLDSAIGSYAEESHGEGKMKNTKRDTLNENLLSCTTQVAEDHVQLESQQLSNKIQENHDCRQIEGKSSA